PAGAARAERRLLDGARALERGRDQEAVRTLRPLVQDAPGVGEAHRLLGVALYRLRRWREAARHLEVFHNLTGRYEVHAILADCHRAMRHWTKVERLWEELRAASPGAELVSEGRIVAAGARADRGDVAGAIALLAGRAAEPIRRPRDHHLRLWYVLADLQERAGDVPAARDLFARVARHDRAFADVAERLQTLG
ncbi:MAG: hypothetical protein ACYDAD_13790, partial [Acidimicrobiales bacterium]